MTYAKDVLPGTPFYHGTRADLAVGNLIVPGFGSNFTDRALRHIYFSASLEAATWGAELAQGDGGERIYIVKPTGPFEDDPNLTDKNDARTHAGGMGSTAVPATSPCPIARRSRCASSAKSPSGSRIRPSGCKR